MKRRSFLAITGIALSSTTLGCLGTDSSDEGGGIQAMVMDTAPTAADVVEFSDSPAFENDDIRQVVTDAVQSEEHSTPATDELRGDHFEEVRSVLSELPRYAGDEPGYYVRHDSEPIRIRIFVEE